METGIIILIVIQAIVAIAGIGYGRSQRETINKQNDEIKYLCIDLKRKIDLVDSYEKLTTDMSKSFLELMKNYEGAINTLKQLKKLEELRDITQANIDQLKSKAQLSNKAKDHDDNIL